MSRGNIRDMSPHRFYSDLKSSRLVMRDLRAGFSTDGKTDEDLNRRDFFAATATVVGLLRETLERRFGDAVEMEVEVLREVEGDLMVAHRNYTIEKNNENSIFKND